MQLDFSQWNVSIIKEYFDAYTLSGSIAYMIIYILLCAGIWKSTDKKKKEMFVYPAFFFVVLILNPIFYYTIGQKLRMQARFYRFFWILPVGILIASWAAGVVSEVKKRKRWIIMFLIISLIVFGGDINFSNYRLAQNIYKISDTQIELSCLLHDEGEIERPIVLSGDAPYSLWQYDGGLRWVLNRKDYMSYSIRVSEVESVDKIIRKGNAKKIVKLLAISQYPVSEESAKSALDELQVDYIVLCNDTLGEEYFSNLGYYVKGNTGEYTVYKRD